MFHTRFKPTFDVLYGISEWRDKYLDSWSTHKKNEIRAGGGTVTLQVMLELERAAQQCLINYYNRPISAVEAKFITSDTLADRIRSKTDKSTKTYIDVLLSSRYTPTSIREDASIRSIPKNDNRLPQDEATFRQYIQDPGRRKAMVEAALYLAIRRACKFGIEYIMAYKSGTVHYVTDGITMTDVVGKTQMPIDMGTRTGVPITTSELRYIFRNWHWFRERLDKGLVFWRSYAPTTAPWITDPKIWIPYARHRVDKYKAAKQASPDYDGENVSGFYKFAPIDPALAIDYFGRIKTTDKIPSSDDE
jgi:hypothetical protein